MTVAVGEQLDFNLKSTTGDYVTPQALLQDKQALVITGFPLAFTGG